MKCEVLFHPPSHRNTQYFSFTYKNTVPFSLSHRATLVKLCVCVCVCVCVRARVRALQGFCAVCSGLWIHLSKPVSKHYFDYCAFITNLDIKQSVFPKLFLLEHLSFHVGLGSPRSRPRWYLFSCSVMSSSSVILWTVAHQAPLSMGCFRQEYWSGLPFPTPGDLPNPGIKPASILSPALQADSLPLSHRGNPRWH